MITPADIARRRLANQDLVNPKATRPSDVVSRLGAVQAQDYAGAKWAIGLRTRGVQDEDVERAFNAGEIIRTHVLRPTWHFVAQADLRWMLALTGPRVHAACAWNYRALELDAAEFRRSRQVLEKALGGGRHLIRSELAKAFQQARIDTKVPPRFAYFLINAELEGVICSGPRRGKQFTYALLDERVPPASPLSRDEALLELTTRYFTTRGPATPRDFAWWSGLTIAEIKRGLEIAGTALRREMVEGQTYWLGNNGTPRRATARLAHLLPNYDEFFIGFKDRSAIGQELERQNISLPGEAFVANILLMDGQVIGGWRRTIENHAVRVTVTPMAAGTSGHRRAMTAAADRLAKFLGLPVELTIRAR